MHATDAIVVDMQEALHAAEAGMARIHRKVPLQQSLPHQLIHGDLNASNVRRMRTTAMWPCSTLSLSPGICA
jgi:Ser/Thr protein kinase RdoA (MazF antagonist)